jgi:hypothetical protein
MSDRRVAGDPTAVACSLGAWSDVFDVFAAGPRALYLRYLPAAVDPAGLGLAHPASASTCARTPISFAAAAKPANVLACWQESR